MTKTIHFARGLELPLSFITETNALVGVKGSGKTYGAGRLGEQMHDVGAQVVFLDPVGNWYGLRLAADGEGPGLDIPIFGGEHGDIPLTEKGGAEIARVIVEQNLSAILDVSDFRKAAMKRFMVAFAEELFHLKKRSPLHLFIEEAKLFVPEMGQMRGDGGPEKRLLGAFEDIVRRGRNYGIGCTLMDQRPQSVNKNVLSQVQNLIVMQLIGAHERKAIKAWISDNATAALDLDELAGLQQGQGFFWSPGRRIYQKIQILKKRTYDASATPTFGEEMVPPPALADIDMDALRAALEETIEAAESESPKHLRAELAKAQRQIKTLEAGAKTLAATMTVEPVEVQVPVTVITPQDLGTMEGALDDIDSSVAMLRRHVADAFKRLERVQRGDFPFGTRPKAPPRPPRPQPVAARAPATRAPTNGQVKLSRGARRMLCALALRSEPMTRAAWGIWTVAVASGGGFGNYIGSLISDGLVKRTPDKKHYVATEAVFAEPV